MGFLRCRSAHPSHALMLSWEEGLMRSVAGSGFRLTTGWIASTGEGMNLGKTYAIVFHERVSLRRLRACTLIIEFLASQANCKADLCGAPNGTLPRCQLYGDDLDLTGRIRKQTASRGAVPRYQQAN